MAKARRDRRIDRFRYGPVLEAVVRREHPIEVADPVFQEWTKESGQKTKNIVTRTLHFSACLDL